MRKVVIIATTLFIALCFSACKNERSCKYYCDCQYYPLDTADTSGNTVRIDGDDWEKCVDDCLDKIEGKDRDCHNAFQDFARCVDVNSCDPEDCQPEAKEWNKACK